MDALGIPWFAWIAIVAIVVGGLTAVFGPGRKDADSPLLTELEQVRDTARHLQARVESLEQRVATLERGLPGTSDHP